jgi:hypothetical protein
MDEMDSRMRSNMERILRAQDVIPPFDGHAESYAPDVEHAYRPSEQRVARSGGDEPRSTPPTSASLPEASAPEEQGDIPTFDLGERILAEQRRMTARKRRRPGVSPPEVQAEPQDRADQERPPAPVASAPSGSDEGASIQRIVADIVARDIERLCEGLKRAPQRVAG